MIVAIHQPQYIAWAGYFDKMDKADVFVFLDTVQFKKNEFQNRNLIKGPQGPQWLTVPVIHRFGQAIREVEIHNGAEWGKRHLMSIVSCYGKAPFFKEYIGSFEELFQSSYDRLSEVNIAVSRLIARLLGITTSLVVASELDNVSDMRDQRLVDITKRLGGDIYLSGAGGKGYVNEEIFAASRVGIIYQSFVSPRYPQLFGDFAANLSAVDILFNVGPEAIDYIRGGKKL